MTKVINGDTYSDLITSADPRPMACGSIQRKKIDRIVIHHNATTNKDIAIDTWLASGNAQTSAHYEVADNEIIGIVGEETTAWHAGNSDMNARSIGIENLNSTLAPTWQISKTTFENLARLVADICRRYGFKPDTTHVISHNQVVPTACPGGIDMNRLRARAQQIYDGNNANANKPKPSKRRYGYRVDDLQFVNGIWQVKNNVLAGFSDFDWTDNGINVAFIDKIDPGTGENTKDQILKIGDYFAFQPSSLGIIVQTVSHEGKPLSKVQFPDGFVWLSTTTIDKLIYG